MFFTERLSECAKNTHIYKGFESCLTGICLVSRATNYIANKTIDSLSQHLRSDFADKVGGIIEDCGNVGNGQGILEDAQKLCLAPIRINDEINSAIDQSDHPEVLYFSKGIAIKTLVLGQGMRKALLTEMVSHAVDKMIAAGRERWMQPGSPSREVFDEFEQNHPTLTPILLMVLRMTKSAATSAVANKILEIQSTIDLTKPLDLRSFMENMYYQDSQLPELNEAGQQLVDGKKSLDHTFHCIQKELMRMGIWDGAERLESFDSSLWRSSSRNLESLKRLYHELCPLGDRCIENVVQAEKQYLSLLPNIVAADSPMDGYVEIGAATFDPISQACYMDELKDRLKLIREAHEFAKKAMFGP